MGSLVLVLLVIGWAVVLLPAALRRHTERRSGDSIGDFRDRLSLLRRQGSHHSFGRHPLDRNLGPVGPVRSLATMQPAARHADLAVARARSRRAKKRRRDVLAGLLASMVGSAVLALVPGFSALWMLHLVLDLLFVVYVVALLRVRHGALPVRSAQPIHGTQHDDLADDWYDDVDHSFAWSHAANE